MQKQSEAIIRLLRDEDPNTVDLVKSQLAQSDRQTVANLLALLSRDDAVASHHIHVVMGQIDSRDALAEMTSLCRNFPERGDWKALEQAAFILARALVPGSDVDSARRQLDEWGEVISARLVGVKTAAKRVQLLGEFFGCELQFRGNSDDYYNASNSLLPEVIESRLGIPISLALVYLLASARAGIELEGVSFPGHFIIRHDGILFDPFDGGHILTLDDCTAILAKQNLEPVPAHFNSASPRALLRRMLANLLYIYQSEDKVLADTIAGWIHDLEA